MKYVDTFREEYHKHKTILSADTEKRHFLLSDMNVSSDCVFSFLDNPQESQDRPNWLVEIIWKIRRNPSRELLNKKVV